MPTYIKRAVIPVLLIIGGFASLFYGAKIHTVPVLADMKSEITVEVPDMQQPMQPSFPSNEQFAGPPKMRKQTVEQTKQVTIIESEPSLIREVSVGGIALNDSRKIMRTYSGKPPSLCPT
jgi:hypothetical protein